MLDAVMPWMTRMGQVEVIVPLLLLPFVFPRFRSSAYFYSALCCNFIPFLLQQGLKSLFNYDRPLAFFSDTNGQVHILSDWQHLYHRSFPSGHCAGAFSVFCFLALLLPERYKRAGLLLFIPALLVGYSRVYLAAHFVEDVYFGSMAGTVFTTLIFSAMKRLGWTP